MMNSKLTSIQKIYFPNTLKINSLLTLRSYDSHKIPTNLQDELPTDLKDELPHLCVFGRSPLEAVQIVGSQNEETFLAKIKAFFQQCVSFSSLFQTMRFLYYAYSKLNS